MSSQSIGVDFGPSPSPRDAARQDAARPPAPATESVGPERGLLGGARPVAALRLLRLVLFLAGGWVITAVHAGSGFHPLAWWRLPGSFELLVLWSLLWHALVPAPAERPFALSGMRRWLRPGTVRLPAFQGRVPFTGGSSRTALDIVLYAAVPLGCAALLATAGATGASRLGVAGLLVVLGALALRDRTPVLAARVEVHGLLLLPFLTGATDPAFALKGVLVAMVWCLAAAAVSSHAPFGLASAAARQRWLRRRRLPLRLWRGDGRPARAVVVLRALLVAVAFVVPAVLLVSRGGPATVVGLAVLLATGAGAAGLAPRSLPLETFALAGVASVLLFGRSAGIGVSETPAWLVAATVLVMLALPALVTLRPGRVSLLLPERRVVDHAAEGIWLVRPEAVDRFAAACGGLPPDPVRARDLAALDPRATGRALAGLTGRATDDPSRLVRIAGETVAVATTGWPAARPDATLVAALTARGTFAPGEVRLLTVAPPVLLRGEERYRLLDPGAGLIEQGVLDADDVLQERHWRTDNGATIPVEVHRSAEGPVGYSTPAAFAFLSTVDAETWTGRLGVASADASVTPVVAAEPAPSQPAAVRAPARRPRPPAARDTPRPPAARDETHAGPAGPGRTARAGPGPGRLPADAPPSAHSGYPGRARERPGAHRRAETPALPPVTGVSTAVVVGSGPNGLTAACLLARAGLTVTVVEAAAEIGGGTRSSELTPGLLHDHCSAVHPLGVSSPVFAQLDLARFGLEWLAPEVDLAHPLDGGRAARLVRGLDETAAGLGPDGAAWRRAFGPLSERFDALAGDALRLPRAPAPPPAAAGPLRAAGRAAGVLGRPPLVRRRGPGPVRRGRRARRRAADAAAQRRPGRDPAGRGAPPRLAGGARRLPRDHRRAGRRPAASTAGASRPGAG